MDKYNYFLSVFIANVRSFKNLTQKKFGQKIDKSEIAVRKYESGKTKIPFSVLFLIIKIFELNIFEVKRLLDYVLFQVFIFPNETNQENIYFKTDLMNIFKNELFQYLSALLSVKNLTINDFTPEEINPLIDSILNIFNQKIEILIKYKKVY